ncbi:hypothetical protein GCK32_008706 [Trichostrongylus colubriformis]|uniref:Uncharacterized protein n=1 Tax=Trichostrongylus colubriformis TaxID=6319 RepID=A0AAN8FGA1_TRICO
MDFPPSCRHGIRYDDLHFTYFEVALVILTAIDVFVLVYFLTKFKCMKTAYEELLKKTDDDMAELKKLQETTSMQAIVPLLYLRKCKRMTDTDTTTNESTDLTSAVPKTPLNGAASVLIDRTQKGTEEIRDYDENQSKE